MTREPPAHWQQALGDWGRAQDRLGHVEVWWDADVSRWVLVEHVPAFAVPAHVLAALTEDPLQTPFRARQHAVYRATGKVPILFWIVQGDRGGHKVRYSEVEATLAQWYGGSREPPAPGSLPYADFDQRVLDALRGYDWVMREYQHYADAAAGDAAEALRRMRADMVAHTEARMHDTIEAALPALLAADLPVADGPPPDYAEQTARFIETGESTARAGQVRPGPRVTVPATI